MESIKWDERYRLGFEMIDSQHEEIFRYFRQLSERLVRGEYSQVLETLTRFLDDYIRYHFAQEEEFQSFIDYPEQEFHHQTHEDFIETYSRFKETLGSKTVMEEAKEGLKIMSDWMKNHIMKEDYEMVKYIKDNNL